MFFLVTPLNKFENAFCVLSLTLSAILKASSQYQNLLDRSCEQNLAEKLQNRNYCLISLIFNVDLRSHLAQQLNVLSLD
jgi:hypothetical protein